MCLFRKDYNIPAPPPLQPAPPPPAPPAPPTPSPKPLVTDVNPQVQRARSKKDKNPQTKGTGALRIPLGENVNTGGQTTGGNY
tara:strand:- start:104 stop:352 length:249 start_codon:yes stop_codon:yes gene_type:complete